jgi:hypothetical protein
MLAAFLAMLLGLAVAPQAAAVPDVTRLTVSSPTIVTEIDPGKLGGDPLRLAWGTNGTLYLRVAQTDRWGNERAKHYLVATHTPPAKVTPTGEEPAWAAVYWASKSELRAPGDPLFRIEVESRIETAKSTNTANGGDLAGMSSAALPPTAGGQGVPQGMVADAASKSQQVTIVSMKAKGQPLGEWANAHPEPGMRFGWAPSPMSVLAYVDRDKQLALLDREGHKLQVPGTMDVLFPAWSPDGKQIAYLQKKDKKKYSLMIVDVVVGR